MTQNADKMADFCDHDDGYSGSKNASYFSTVFLHRESAP
jgi:hypothetical protein